jgi:DNA-binding Xre family transcriptional regulator
MKEESYEFDPCSIDDSDKEAVTLDNWKPTEKKSTIVASKWRQEQIGDNFNQQPGIDELNKIHMHLKKKVSDAEIMHAFGITSETLIAIKKDKYDPVDGISLDNQSKIYKEFKRLEDRIDSLLRGINYIAECMFTTRQDKAAYKKSFRKPKKAKVGRKLKVENNEICEDFCELDEEICGQSTDDHPEEE